MTSYLSTFGPTVQRSSPIASCIDSHNHYFVFSVHPTGQPQIQTWTQTGTTWSYINAINYNPLPGWSIKYLPNKIAIAWMNSGGGNFGNGHLLLIWAGGGTNSDQSGYAVVDCDTAMKGAFSSPYNGANPPFCGSTSTNSISPGTIDLCPTNPGDNKALIAVSYALSAGTVPQLLVAGVTMAGTGAVSDTAAGTNYVWTGTIADNGKYRWVPVSNTQMVLVSGGNGNALTASMFNPQTAGNRTAFADQPLVAGWPAVGLTSNWDAVYLPTTSRIAVVAANPAAVGSLGRVGGVTNNGYWAASTTYTPGDVVALLGGGYAQATAILAPDSVYYTSMVTAWQWPANNYTQLTETFVVTTDGSSPSATDSEFWNVYAHLTATITAGSPPVTGTASFYCGFQEDCVYGKQIIFTANMSSGMTAGSSFSGVPITSGVEGGTPYWHLLGPYSWVTGHTYKITLSQTSSTSWSMYLQDITAAGANLLVATATFSSNPGTLVGDVDTWTEHYGFVPGTLFQNIPSTSATFQPPVMTLSGVNTTATGHVNNPASCAWGLPMFANVTNGDGSVTQTITKSTTNIWTSATTLPEDGSAISGTSGGTEPSGSTNVQTIDGGVLWTGLGTTLTAQSRIVELGITVGATSLAWDSVVTNGSFVAGTLGHVEPAVALPRSVNNGVVNADFSGDGDAYRTSVAVS